MHHVLVEVEYLTISLASIILVAPKCLIIPQYPQPGKNFGLCFFPYTASVQQDYICFLRACCGTESVGV